MKDEKFVTPLNISELADTEKDDLKRSEKMQRAKIIKNRYKPQPFMFIFPFSIAIVSTIFVLTAGDYFFEGNLILLEWLYIMIVWATSIILLAKYVDENKFYNNHRKLMLFFEAQNPQDFQLKAILKELNMHFTKDQKSRIFKTLERLKIYKVNTETEEITKLK